MNKFYLSMLFAFLCGSVFLSCKKEKNEAPIKTEQTEAIESSEDEAKAEDEDDVAYIEDEDEENNQKKDGNMYQDGNWYYHTYEDPMTDEKSFNAGCESKESQDICGKRTTLHLVLMHIKDYDVVILGIDGGVLRQDRLPLAYVRFDGGEIEKYSVMADGAHEQYIVDVNKFIKHLKQSKKCAITVEAQDGGRATYTFDTAGLKWNYN